MNITVVQFRKCNKGQNKYSRNRTRELIIKERIKEKQSLKAEGRYKYSVYIRLIHIFSHLHEKDCPFFIMVYHRILNIVPCAVQQDLVYPSYVCNSLHLLIPNSQPFTFPPLPQFLATTQLFSVSVSLQFDRYVHFYRIQIPHINDNIYGICLSFSDFIQYGYVEAHLCCCRQYDFTLFIECIYHSFFMDIQVVSMTWLFP